MPLVEPLNSSGHFLREKVLLIAPGKVGKSSAWLSIAWWAFQSGDHRTFFVLDTDDEAVLHVINEEKYNGMLRSVNGEIVNENGNIVLYVVNLWEDYLRATEKIQSDVKSGDWFVIDFVTHAWTEVQSWYLRSERNKTKAESMLEADRAGLSGWEAFRDINYQVVNPIYFQWFKSITVQSRAHIFLTAEQGEINEKANKLPEKDQDHLQKFGKWKAEGQKKLPYQCRSYLRMQRLARGRVLFTLGDRARKTLEGDDCKDFFQDYMRNIAGWSIAE